MKKPRVFTLGFFYAKNGRNIMTNEELNTKLYEKMMEEFENYHDWIITLPPEKILDHAVEYVVKNEIKSY